MQKITPFLWFNDNAEDAMNFYVSIFKNSKIGRVTRYGDAGPGPKGQAMSVAFTLEGQEFMGLNGGPQFSFTPAISLFVSCETQDEVDELWEKLSEEGSMHLRRGVSRASIVTDFEQRLRAALGASYTIQRELGGGGMSRVFVAEDTALARPVVIKVLHPELAAGVNVDRFKREVQLLARLQHPHIVPILSAGEVEGLPYY